LLADLKGNISKLEAVGTTKETRFVQRVLRNISSIRKRLTIGALRELIAFSFFYDSDLEKKQELLHYLSSFPSTVDDTFAAPKDEKKPAPSQPEVEVYVYLLTTIFLIDRKHYQEVSRRFPFAIFSHFFFPLSSKAALCSTSLVNRLHSYNRRTLNPLSAKVYFYYSRSYELLHKLEDIREYANFLSFFFFFFFLCCSRMNLKKKKKNLACKLSYGVPSSQ
jgi:26S proteasome regulatory subunit N3